MKYLIPIDGLREMMVKPLLVQLLGDIGKMLGLGDEIFMSLQEEPLRLVRSPNGNIEDNRLYNLKSTAELPNNYLKLENYEFYKFNDEIFDNQFFRPQSQPILTDYEFSVTPAYRTSELNMTIRYYSSDKVQLQKSIDNVLVRLFGTQGKYNHTLDMRYPLGRRLSVLLIEMFKIRAKRDIAEIKAKLHKEMGELADDAKVNLYFTDYLKSIAGRRIHCFANETKRSGKRKGKGLSVGVMEKHRVVTGMITTNIDKLQVDEEDNRYYLEFEYEIKFEHPYGYLIDQPIMVYNTLLPKELRQFITRDAPPEFDYSTNFYTNAVGSIPDKKYISRSTTRSFTIPEIDTPGGVEKTGTMHRIFSRLVQIKIDKKTKKSYVELDINNIGFDTDLDPFDLKEEIIEFILDSEREYVTQADRSIFYFTLTEGTGSFTSKPTLTLDEEGILRSIIDLDVKKTYRVCMYVRMDNSDLSHVDRKRILTFLRRQERFIHPDIGVHRDNFAVAAVNQGILYSPYEIRKRYLSTLNLLMLSYNLTPKQIQALNRFGYNRDNAIFYIAGHGFSPLPLVQIYHTDILRRIDDEEEN